MSFYTGKLVTKKSKQKCEVLEEILKLIDTLKIEINYSLKKKNDIVFDFAKNCKTELKNMLNNQNNSILPQDAEQKLHNLLNEIGTTDVDGQNLLLEKYKKQFEEILKKEQAFYVQRASISTKLAVCIGLVFIILIWWGNMNIDILFRIGAIGILTLVISQVLSHAGKNEIATLTTLAGLVIVLVMVLDMVAELFATVQKLFGLWICF